MLDFTDKIVCITGATKGIGRAVALKFAFLGAKLVICGRDKDALESLEREINDHYELFDGTVISQLTYDVTNRDDVTKNFDELRKTIHRVDVLVNNAGILKDAIIPMITRNDVDNVLATNTVSVLHHLQLASRIMAKNGGGSIVNVSSIVGRDGNVGQALYSMSKAAVIGLTKSAAKELAAQNIRVNAVAPGVIDTNMTRNIPKEKLDSLVSRTPMNRLGTPEEVADVIVFLASDMAKFITGQIVSVDGGLSL